MTCLHELKWISYIEFTTGFTIIQNWQQQVFNTPYQPTINENINKIALITSYSLVLFIKNHTACEKNLFKKCFLKKSFNPPYALPCIINNMNIACIFIWRNWNLISNLNLKLRWQVPIRIISIWLLYWGNNTIIFGWKISYIL